MDSSDIFSSHQMLKNNVNESLINFNFKTFFLIIILICACCLLSFGYNFEINNFFNSSLSMFACFILLLFMFYVFYELFKKDSCDEINKRGSDRLLTAFNRGFKSFGDQPLMPNNYMNNMNTPRYNQNGSQHNNIGSKLPANLYLQQGTNKIPNYI